MAQQEEISATGAFIAIGHKPITGFLNGQDETDENGYIILKQHRNSIEGYSRCWRRGRY